MDIVQLLAELPLMAGLSSEALAELAAAVRQEYLAAGQLLFRQGDPGDCLYLVTRGKLKIYIHDEQKQEIFLNTCEAGDSLGQITLIDQEPRTANVAALEDTDLFVLDRTTYLSVIEHQPPGTLDRMRDVAAHLRLGYADLLRKIGLFKDLPDDSLRAVARRLERQRLAGGEVLFHMGDPGNALYVIDRGRVKIVIKDSSGGELVLNQLGPGEALGEVSLLDEAPRSAGVIAAEPTEVLRLDRDTFLDVLRSYPEVSLDMMRILSRRLRYNITFIEQMIELSKRIAEGDYNIAMEQLHASRSDVPTQADADRAMIDELLSAFFSMIKGVQEREEDLKEQVRILTIQIDEKKRREEVESLTGSDFFAELKESARRLREQNAGDQEDNE
jgi:CRP-like cAMP-binding protein